MKRFAILFLLSGVLCLAEEVTLTKSAILKGERNIVSLKAGTVVELLSRGEKVLMVRHGKITGTIPAGSIDETVAGEAKKEEAPPPAPTAPAKKAGSIYGKAVEKAKENAGKHDKNVVKPVDEIAQ